MIKAPYPGAIFLVFFILTVNYFASFSFSKETRPIFVG